MAATKFSFFVISTSDRGDFPRIIVIALFQFNFNQYKILHCVNMFGLHFNVCFDKIHVSCEASFSTGNKKLIIY